MIMKTLPDAEFEVMKIIWNNEVPITTSTIMQNLQHEKSWKVQTLITLLNRLVSRGFLKTEKPSKERTYFPLVTEEEYLQYETKDFITRFHKNSITSVVATLAESRQLTEDDLEELTRWLEERKE